MSNIRYQNSSNPFWEFLHNLNDAGPNHPFYAAFNPEARNRGPPPEYDGPRPAPQDGPESPPPPGSDHSNHGSAHQGPHSQHRGPHHHCGGSFGRGGWAGQGRRGRCGGGPNFNGWPTGGFDMSKLGEFLQQFAPDNTTVPRPPRREGAHGDGDGAGKDFAPEADIFDTEDAYVVHVSLAGAKKEDVGVNWDADKSELSIAGVIYRPGDEDFLKTLALDERKVGVFERKVSLGSRTKPAQVDSEAISAKMEDGILVIIVTKLDKDFVDVKKVDIE
ncbi:MAG: hypothetical protein Q9217_006845 [Psora testacea]